MNLVERAKNIILKPKTEWDIIVGEQTTAAKLYQDYIIFLAAIPALAILISQSFIGVSVPFLGFIKYPIQQGLISAVITYISTLVSVYIAALVISYLAPKFNGVKDNVAALKLIAYSFTPAWVGGIFNLIPGAGSTLVFIASLYGLYVLYLGLPKLMKSPPEKTISYIIVSIIAIMVIYFVIGAIAAAVTAPMLII